MKKLLSSLLFFIILAIISFGIITIIPNVNLNNLVQNVFGPKYEYKNNIDKLKIGRASLNDKEKDIYDAIYKSIDNFENEVQISSFPHTEIERIYNVYLNDSPEHFYIKNLSYKLVGENVHSIFFEYNYDKTIAEQKLASIQKETNPVVENAKTLKSDYEKSKYVHDYILKKTKYTQTNSESIYRIDGPLLYGQAVCQGYGKTYQYIMNLLGYKALYVRGYSRNENHGWNLVELGGKFYNVDTTWDDIESDGIILNDYTYLHITDSEISKDHKIDESKNVKLPVADSIDLSYYAKNDAIIGNHYTDKEKISNIFINAYKNQEKNIYLKFTTKSNMDSFMKDTSFISNILNNAKQYSKNKQPNSKGYSYIKNEHLNTLTIIIN